MTDHISATHKLIELSRKYELSRRALRAGAAEPRRYGNGFWCPRPAPRSPSDVEEAKL